MSIPQNRERSPLWLRLLRGTLSLVAWAIVIVLAVAVWFRLFRYDATYELVWLNSFTRYVYLPAYASLVWARWMRRWVLLATAGAIVACHLTWVLPDFAPAAPTAARSETNPTLRIFLANVSIMNDHFDAMFSEIAAAQPQVVVLIEYNNAWHAAAESSPVLAAFPHRAKTPGFGGNTVAVFSQVPIVDQFQDRFQMERSLGVDLEWQDRQLRLFGLHAPRPVEIGWRNYFGYWEHVSELIDSQPRPLVVVGDFNATQYAKLYRRLTGKGLWGAHEMAGRGYATTWPNGTHWLPPIRIDHVLVSAEFCAVRAVEGMGSGSDHRPVIVDLQWNSSVE